MNGEIVKFGKYKNQPVEVLKQDREYVKWLQTQDWFRANYQSINNIIINNFNAPSETPEHNKIQTLFLDQSFCDKMIDYMINNNLLKSSYTKEICVKKSEYLMGSNGTSNAYLTDPVWEQQEINFNYKYNGVYFELKGVDVTLDYIDARFYIEIKPNLSDDYPAVLRQMQALRSNVLICDSYDGIGATFDQVKDIFYKSGKIRVLKISDFS